MQEILAHSITRMKDHQHQQQQCHLHDDEENDQASTSCGKHTTTPSLKTLSDAKAILRDLQSKQTKEEMLAEYTNVLNIVVDAISKMAESSNIDCHSITSATLPETVITTDSSSLHAESCQDERLLLQEVEQQRDDHQEEEEDDEEQFEWDVSQSRVQEDDDVDYLSDSSDVIPLVMMDEDALDEISFTRELMGYEEGFGPDNTHCAPILEEGETASELQQHKKETAPALLSLSTKPNPVQRSKTDEKRKEVGNKSHRRQSSGGSAPTVLVSGTATNAKNKQATSPVCPTTTKRFTNNNNTVIPPIGTPTTNNSLGSNTQHSWPKRNHNKNNNKMTTNDDDAFATQNEPRKKRFFPYLGKHKKRAAAQQQKERDEEDGHRYDVEREMAKMPLLTKALSRSSVCEVCFLPMVEGDTCDCGKFCI